MDAAWATFCTGLLLQLSAGSGVPRAALGTSWFMRQLYGRIWLTRKLYLGNFLVNQREPMSAEIPELTAHLGYRLRQVSNHVSHAFARKVAVKEVTVAEWAMMRVLHGVQPVAPSRLADKMGMTRGAISKLADRLISKSLVAREASSTDGRAHTLRLTPQGAHMVPELAALAEQNEAECFAHLSTEDRTTLGRIMKEAVEQLGITATPVE